MMKIWGTAESFSPTHARFAADLLTDCREELLGITVVIDVRLEAERRRSLCEFADGQASDSVPVSPRMDTEKATDRDKFIVAAAYAEWISDHIWQEAARCDREIAAFFARFATTADQLALLERQRGEPFDGVTPAAEPPPFPEPLDDLLYVVQGRRAQIDCIRAWLLSASSAVSESNTATMNAIGQHIGLLSRWLDDGLGAPSRLEEPNDPA
ncbi:hypothetical protein [Mycolicibacterium sp.]|uniref:hypothetical protein n=2 Tax=Mycolicibacterium sp. TaxID=2320850 RepID=UPI0037C51214